MISKENIIRWRPVAWLLRKLHPYDSICVHCHLPWTNVNPHFVDYKTGEGFFAVCEHCYQRMTDEELEEAYQKLWHVVWRDCGKPCSYIVFRNAYMKDIKQRHVDNPYSRKAEM